MRCFGHEPIQLWRVSVYTLRLDFSTQMHDQYFYNSRLESDQENMSTLSELWD